MSKQTQHTFTLVIRGGEMAITIQREGQTISTRAPKPGRPWSEAGQDEVIGSLSLESCEQVHLVLRERMRLESGD